MRLVAVALVGLLLMVNVSAPGHAQPPPTLRLVAMGDTATGAEARANVNASLAEGAQGLLGLGDYDYAGTGATWKALFRPLLDRGAYLAIGNHDSEAGLAPYFDAGTAWSRSAGGARIVALDMRHDLRPGGFWHEWARDELCGASESMRILMTHAPWWLEEGAVHPAREFHASTADMDALVDACGVDLVLAGHEHNYQRRERASATYVIAGTGGAPLYPVRGYAPGTIASFAEHGRVVLDIRPDGYSAEFRTLDGAVLDAFGQPPVPWTYRAAFTHTSGNEWWISARVAANAPIVRVETSIDNGAWRALELRSWGAWASSYHAPDGSVVRFQATTTNGATNVSGCVVWPHGAPTACGAPPPPPPPPGFSASFTSVSGNEWWVQANVRATGGTLAGVDARADGGAWHALTLRSWGAWAASFHVPPGSTVQLRARSTDGGESLSGCYRWTAATSVPCGGAPPPPTGFDATFRNVRGNEWWVEADVDATGGTLAGVDARVGGGAWTPLARTSWGSWAKSLHAPPGSAVELRARSVEGGVDHSVVYAWPP